MKKTIQIIVLAALCLNFTTKAQPAKSISSKNSNTGKVVSASSGEPLPGALIKVTTSNQTFITDDRGEFSLNLNSGSYEVAVHYLNYKTKVLTIEIPLKEILTISLDAEEQVLKEVEIVSTGYQNIPKERATGSFTLIDNKTLNRNLGTNILDRLEGVASGLLVNKGLPGNNNSKIAIRGRSTIFAPPEPTVILDGFPYEGTIDQINPSDVESITLLKDAAAASIWGAKAGNGVIVITTKRGKENQKAVIEVSSVFTVGEKPDLYYLPQIKPADFIDLEAYLFSKGFYNSLLNSGYSAVSGAVEIFNRRKNKEISATDSAQQIALLKTRDVRSDLDRYMYRPSVYQQYSINIKGGTKLHQYYMSAGYDKNYENLVTNDYDRLTIRANNNFSLLENKLQISGGVGFTSGNTNNNPDTYIPYSPYDRIADEEGNALPVVNSNGGLRLAYQEKAGDGKLLDWLYKPKNEFISNGFTRVEQYKINAGVLYKILDGLDLDAKYQYLKEISSNESDRGLDTYYTRNFINTYSSISGNSVTRAVPLGHILNRLETGSTSSIIRLQLNYNKVVGERSEINAIAGYEGGNYRGSRYAQTLYGYDPETKINLNNTINPSNPYPYFYRTLTALIPTAPGLSGIINISQSYYTNVSYAYDKRYIISGSARRDESNLFGVKTNQKGVPLWSAGLAWVIHNERFYNLNLISSLKLRATYGYNGNVDKSVSALLTSQNGGSINLFGSNYARILNPPNPSLRWEKVKTWNFGLDYTFKGNRVTGSVDLYQKDAHDLIGNHPIATQTGILQYKGNGANLRTKGIDVVLNMHNPLGEVSWNSSVLFNYNYDKVTSYKVKQESNSNIIGANIGNPLEGYPYYSIFSFPSAGLDATGSPQGYLNGEVSKNYTSIIRLLDPDQIKFHGSASPKLFGSIINSIGYKNLDLSFNIVYKLDYYFRRSNVFSGSNNYLFRTSAYFESRWQKPGDELVTKIPAFVYPNNTSMYSFFQKSEDLVERGDHIRLQDIRLAYRLSAVRFGKIFNNASFFLYSKNIGILWRKNKLQIDPDYGTTSIPQSISYSLGVNLSL